MSQSLYTYTSGVSAARAMIADLEAGSGLTRVPESQGAQVELMAFSASGATTADSATSVTASYTGLDLGATPDRAMMTFSLTAGALESGSAVMISNPNGLSTIANVTDSSLHLVFTETYCNVGYFSGGVLTNVTQLTYTRTLTKDGATKYRGGFGSLDGSGIVVHLPDGRSVTVSSAQFAANAGRYCQFESFTDAALGTRATFYAVTFEALS